jgi:hypothetical protein
MSMIESRRDEAKGLTVHTCTGAVTQQEVLVAIRSHYDEKPTPHNLWDLREADLTGLVGIDVQKIASFTKAYSPERPSGKTALVSTSDLGFGLARIYQGMASDPKRPVEVKVFRTLEEAMAWCTS